MAATATTTRTVAPAVASGAELRWDDSEFHTGVTATDDECGLTFVTREGKGDWFHIDLGEARCRMSAVMLATGETVAYLGLPADLPVEVSTLAQRRATDSVEWTEYPNVETALVALAFEHLT